MASLQAEISNWQIEVGLERKEVALLKIRADRVELDSRHNATDAAIQAHPYYSQVTRRMAAAVALFEKVRGERDELLRQKESFRYVKV